MSQPSSRRTNEPSGLEVEGSTAGASGADDLAEKVTEHDVWLYMEVHWADFLRWLAKERKRDGRDIISAQL